MKYKKNCVHRIAAGLLAIGACAWAAHAAAPTTPQGVITGKAWTDLSGTAVADLTGSPNFPDTPDTVVYLPYLEWNATGMIATAPGDWGDNYGVQVIGYFYPPSTTSYYFAICADDNAELHLSTDDNPANKKLLARETAWSNPREYVTSSGNSTLEDKLSDTFTGSQWPNREADGGIVLQANQAYYIEVLMKEGTGGDNLSVSVLGAGIDGNLPIPGQYLSSDKPSGSLVITEDPQSQTVQEGSSVTFRVDAEGTPPYTFQWTRNGANIAGATELSYTIAPVLFADNGATFACKVTGAVGSATSANAVLTVIQDTTPPTLTKAFQTDTTFTSQTVVFSELVTAPTATTASNYTLDNGATVSDAALSADGLSVTLTTSPLAEDTEYVLTVNNVEDLVGNVITANSQTPLRTYVFMPGAIVHKKYEGFDDGVGADPNNLFNDPRFGTSPDRADLMAVWEYPADGAGRVAADPTRNYFDTLEGFFIPPTTGDYVFLTAGADRWWLYLSTDDDPANKKLIAAEPGGWSDPRGWVQAHSGSLENRRSDSSTLSEWPELTINLTAGQRYYMLEVHHDPSWCGADDFSATYIMEGDADPANGTIPTIAGSVVGFYVDPSQSEINITQQPASVTEEEGRTAVFTVVATGVDAYGGAIAYQWQRQASGGGAWTDLSGATGDTYQTPLLTLGDSGAKYRVVCSVAGLVVTSDEAALTVVTDVVGPKLVGAGALGSQTGTTFDVGVSFDEVLDPVSAGTQANYSLSEGSITGIKFYAGSPGVVLTASGLTAGSTYTVNVSNVKDISGNVMTPASKAFTVSGMKWGVVGGNELGLANGVLATAEDGFDVYSSGFTEWAMYDETTFVYEQITGDFDKVVRVEYQDASSQWARAGLIARDVTNFGVNRTSQQGGAAGRYQKVHVNPTMTAMGTAGNNSWEGNRRLTTGADTTSAGGGGTPEYPNAWCRLQRAGNLFTIFRSNDGITWTQLGTTTFTPAMPATLYVGPEYTPENGNVDAALRSVFVAKFRDYGDYSAVVQPVIGMDADGVITYSGVLQSSETVNGTYAPVAGATSPYTVPKTGPAMFYRTASQ